MTGTENLLTTISSNNNSNKWELTEYDRQRDPHDPVNDASEITVSPKSLNLELICPICLDMLKNTMATKECLHRFCQECITTALRSGNKECPTCRKKLVSKRSLRPDPNIDLLIAKIYPNREEYDQMQEKAMQTLSRHHSTEALQKSIEEGMKLQAELRKMYRAPTCYESSVDRSKKRRKDLNGSNQSLSDDLDVSVSENSTTATTASFYRQKVSEIEFILRPHPLMESALDVVSASRQTRYLKTTANATVDHLAKFLVTRIKLDRDEADRSSSGASFSSLVEKNSESTAKGDENISPTISQSSKLILPNELNVDLALKSTETCKLYVVCGGGPPLMSLASSGLTELNGDMTLDYVLIKMWGIKKPLEMYFSLSDEKIPSQSTIQFNNYPPATKPENNKLNNK